MKMPIMMAMIAGMGVMGFMYFKKHPDKISKMKQMGRDASRKMYNMLDEE